MKRLQNVAAAMLVLVPAIGLADQGPDDWLPATPEKLLRVLFCMLMGLGHRVPIATVWDCLPKA